MVILEDNLNSLVILVTLLLCVFCSSVVTVSSVTPWIIAHQAPLSMGFPRQEYWSRLPFPPPGDLPNPGSNLHLLHWWADSSPLHPLGIFPTGHCISLLWLKLQNTIHWVTWTLVYYSSGGWEVSDEDAS